MRERLSRGKDRSEQKNHDSMQEDCAHVRQEEDCAHDSMQEDCAHVRQEKLKRKKIDNCRQNFALNEFCCPLQ